MALAWSSTFKEQIRAELLKSRDKFFWAFYQHFLDCLDQPESLSATADAIVVFSHDRVCQESRYPGMTPEHVARINGAVRELRSIGNAQRAPKLVLLGVTEGHDEAKQVARAAGCDPDEIINLGELPLRETHTGQQCTELAAFARKQKWQHIHLYSSYYHMLRLHCTATTRFAGAAEKIHRTIGYVPWPQESESTCCLTELVRLIELEVHKTKSYLSPF